MPRSLPSADFGGNSGFAFCRLSGSKRGGCRVAVPQTPVGNFRFVRAAGRIVGVCAGRDGRPLREEAPPHDTRLRLLRTERLLEMLLLGRR
jgi:hypothetical protein